MRVLNSYYLITYFFILAIFLMKANTLQLISLCDLITMYYKMI